MYIIIDNLEPMKNYQAINIDLLPNPQFFRIGRESFKINPNSTLKINLPSKFNHIIEQFQYDLVSFGLPSYLELVEKDEDPSITEDYFLLSLQIRLE